MPFPSTADIRERVGCSIGRKPGSIARHIGARPVPFSYQQSSLRLSFCAWSSRWIPPPSVEPAESYSGKWQLRAPKSLHRRLAECAKREGVSLNILAFTLLDRLGGVEDRGGRPVGGGDRRGRKRSSDNALSCLGRQLPSIQRRSSSGLMISPQSGATVKLRAQTLPVWSGDPSRPLILSPGSRGKRLPLKSLPKIHAPLARPV